MIKMGNFFAKHNDDRAFEEYKKTVGGISSVLRAADARPILGGEHRTSIIHSPPLSATDRLGRNLERTVTESTARAEVLRQEIAAREAELADVLRAEEAARMGLEALDDRITEDDLSAACGLALEAEMKTPFEEAPAEILEALLSTEQIPQERFDEEMKRREAVNG